MKINGITLEVTAEQIAESICQALNIVNRSKFQPDSSQNTIELDINMLMLSRQVGRIAQAKWAQQNKTGKPETPLTLKEYRSAIMRAAARRNFEGEPSIIDTILKNGEIEKSKAIAVLDFFVKNKPMTDFESLINGSEFSRQDELNRLIRENLNAGNIKDFIEAVAKRHVSAMQAAKAHKLHEETNKMKIEVFAWLDNNRDKFKTLDAAAEAVTKQQPIKFRTARNWVGNWKKLRSAGTV